MLDSGIFSSLYHRFIHHEGGLVFDFLATHLPSIPKDQWPVRAQFGGLYVNGLQINENQELPRPASIEYYEPTYSIEDASNFFPKFSTDWIVFEDDFFIVCFKPAGLPTMPAKEQNFYSLRRYLDRYVGHAVHCPSRLDTSTQGLVIASKDQRTHGLLQQLFEKKQIKKEYHLLTDTLVDWQILEASEPIGKSTAHPVLRCIHGLDAKNAFTRFEVIKKCNSGATFIRALPATGRTHQIRVHASAHGFPIKGDKFYGTLNPTAGLQAQQQNLDTMPKLCLVSYSLVFQHPVSNKLTSIELPSRLFPDWLQAG